MTTLQPELSQPFNDRAKNMPGDSRTLVIAVSGATVDVTLDFQNILTSSSDTATTKYFDNINFAITSYFISPTSDISIKSINGVTLTDPHPIGAADSFTNIRTVAVDNMVLSVPTDGTEITIFVQ